MAHPDGLAAGADDGPQPPQGAPLCARVLPDVAGFDRELDYLVPAELAGSVRAGSVVRVPLQGRKVRGWVTAVPVRPPAGVTLRPLDKVSGWGPEVEVVALAAWAAWRWAGRRRSLLVTASAARAVRHLPLSAIELVVAGQRPGPREERAPSTGRGLVDQAWRPSTHILRLPPAASATDLVMAAAERGPVLVVAPTTARAEAGCTALRTRGVPVALLPEDWAQARAGARVVIGARAAAWGPCPGLASIVVLDAHDEGLVQEQAPTWDAPTVAAERARRAGAPCFWVTACPTVELAAEAEDLHMVSRAEERAGWAPLIVVDCRLEDPRSGLYSKALVAALHQDDRRVVCVLNRKGRAQMLDCGACGEVATCEHCGAGVAMFGDRLVCRRCPAARPVVCVACGSDALRLLKLGVSRAREQLQALSGRATGEVVGGSGPLPGTPVLVGTEAVLYREGELRRSGGVGTVAFLAFDQELLAPRYRAGDEALALLARASRLVGGRSRNGKVLVQTRVPSHPVIAAALLADPSHLTAAEGPVRKALRLPPFGALAVIAGEGAGELAAALEHLATAAPARAGGASGDLEVAPLTDGRWVVRAPDYTQLADALAAAGRPPAPTRVHVGPVRF